MFFQKSKRSSNYKCTINPNSQSGSEMLRDIRIAVKDLNKVNSNKVRVVVRGRGPRRNAEIFDGVKKGSYTSDLPLRHATEVDVYMYNR